MVVRRWVAFESLQTTVFWYLTISTRDWYSMRTIEIYDTTLRDGSQGEGVNFSLEDKLSIAKRLDEAGVNFIEGGYPLSNPKDSQFFSRAANLELKNAQLCAFGMTRRRGMEAHLDPGMKALLQAGTPVVTIVGKTSCFHVETVLGVSLEENLDMIRDTVAYLTSEAREVFYDAEHFFDGWKLDSHYSLETLRAAVQGGATRLILCDTNGGTLPTEVATIVAEVTHTLATPLGIHCHNDCDVAVANTLSAISAGCIQAQGTINGIGERCGNADIISIAANLALKIPETMVLAKAHGESGEPWCLPKRTVNLEASHTSQNYHDLCMKPRICHIVLVSHMLGRVLLLIRAECMFTQLPSRPSRMSILLQNWWVILVGCS